MWLCEPKPQRRSRGWKGSVEIVAKSIGGTSLVAQWLRILLPMQGTRVQALLREDLTRCRATKPVRHNY